MQVITLWLNSVLDSNFSELFLKVNKDWMMTLPDTVLYLYFFKHNLRIYSLEQEGKIIILSGTIFLFLNFLSAYFSTFLNIMLCNFFNKWEYI